MVVALGVCFLTVIGKTNFGLFVFLSTLNDRKEYYALSMQYKDELRKVIRKYKEFVFIFNLCSEIH